MNHVIVIAAIALLVLLFLKVPVYISVLAASVIYFIGSPNVNSMVFAGAVPFGNSVLCYGRCIYELYRRYKKNHGML